MSHASYAKLPSVSIYTPLKGACVTTNLVPLAEAACLALQRHGDARLLYTTAAFAPYSSHHKPDILFSRIAQSGEVHHYFVELFPSVHAGDFDLFVRIVLEHRDFVQSDSEVKLHFAVALGSALPVEAQAALNDERVAILFLTSSGEQLATRILRWADLTIGLAGDAPGVQPFERNGNKWGAEDTLDEH